MEQGATEPYLCRPCGGVLRAPVKCGNRYCESYSRQYELPQWIRVRQNLDRKRVDDPYRAVSEQLSSLPESHFPPGRADRHHRRQSLHRQSCPDHQGRDRLHRSKGRTPIHRARHGKPRRGDRRGTGTGPRRVRPDRGGIGGTHPIIDGGHPTGRRRQHSGLYR